MFFELILNMRQRWEMKGLESMFKIHSKTIQNKISIKAVQLTKMDENFT